MPLDRLRSPKGSHGRRLTSLTDFEFRVWDQYQLSADDFGVMRCSVHTMKADNDSIADRPEAMVQAALERIIAVGLVLEFVHQGRRYICQADWQEFQRVEYPRRSLMPAPPEDTLEQCTKKTQELFRKHPGGESKRSFGRTSRSSSEESPRDSQVIPEESPSERQGVSPPRVTACANGTRLTQTANTDAAVVKPSGPSGRSDGVWAGSLPKDHIHHADCSPNFAACVPSQVHGKLKNALGPLFRGDRGEADAALRDWYRAVWDGLPSEFVMGDAFKFWQAQFDAKWASSADPPIAKPSLAGAQAEIDRQNELRKKRPHA